MSSPLPARPTRIRFLIIATTALAAVVLYLDRVCLSFVEKPVTIDLGLSEKEFEYTLSAFFLTYALFQVPAGFLSDRFGARRMLTLYLLACVLCTIGTAISMTFGMLLFTRLALGIAEAGAYPTCAGLIRRWIPLQSRGLASSCVALGGRLGGASTPFITALLLVALLPKGTSSLVRESDMVDPAKLSALLEKAAPDNTLLLRIGEQLPSRDAAGMTSELNRLISDPKLLDGITLVRPTLPREARTLLDRESRTDAENQRLHRLIIESTIPGVIRPLYAESWRSVFYVYAGFGLLITMLFCLIVRDRAALHPWSNQAEADLVPAPPGQLGVTGMGKKIPYLLITSRNLWLSSMAQFCLNLGWAFLITRLPTFLEKVYQSPIEERGLQSSVPLFAGAFGMLAGGFFTDWLTRRFGVRVGRSLPIGFMPIVGAIAFITVPHLGDAWTVVIAFAFVALATDMTNPATWSLMQDMTGKNVGVALGWANMWGNLGAAASPILLAWLQRSYGWEVVFYFCAAAFITAGAAGLMIDARKPLDNSV